MTLRLDHHSTKQQSCYDAGTVTKFYTATNTSQRDKILTQIHSVILLGATGESTTMYRQNVSNLSGPDIYRS